MTDYTPSQTFEKDVMAAMAVPNASPQFVNDLHKQLVQQAGVLHKPASAPTPRRKITYNLAWAASLLIALALVLTVFLVGPQKVAAAVREFFGFIPGIGLVDPDSPIRVLSEPVKSEKDGITVQVLQALADGEKTVIIYQVDNLSVAAANSQGEAVQTGSLEILRFPDGTSHQPIMGGGEGWGIGYQTRLEFAPLPAESDNAVFIIPVLQGMPPGAAPENWELTLSFVPAPDELDLLPVLDISTPTSTVPDTSTVVPESTEVPVSEAPVEREQDILLGLEKAVELENGFILIGYLDWTGAERVQFAWPEEFQVSNANGEPIPAETVSTDGLGISDTPTRYNFALQTAGKPPGPWQISIPSLMLSYQDEGSFQVDLGHDPVDGQVWEDDRVLELSGMSVILREIKLESETPSEFWLSFTFSSDADLIDIGVWDEQNNSQHISGKGGGPGETGMITSAFSYDHKPSGLREIQVTGMSIRKSGPWQASWQPPAQIEGVEAEQESEQPCLTSEKWVEISQVTPPGNQPLPEGELLMMAPSGQPLQMISLASMDGTIREIDLGSWPSLSPDKKRLAISRGDGLYISNLDSGITAHIPGTAMSDEYPVWSPDGSWLAFLRFPEETIYRIKPDGSQLTPIITSNEIINLSTWTGEDELLVEAFSQAGTVIRSVNMHSGEMTNLIRTGIRKPSSNYAQSSDGRKIAYADSIFGEIMNGIYLRESGEMESRLLAQMQDTVILVGDWSPDGEWLALTLYGPDPELLPILVQPESCQVIPLWQLHGQVLAWVQE